MYDRILVPLDGSPVAEDALPHARSLASRLRSELILLRVDVPIQNLPASRYPEEIGSVAASYLHRMAEPMFLKQLKVRTIVAFGDPAREILACAERERVDLVIVAARRPGGGGLLPGHGVVGRVLRGAKVPVMVVRATGDLA